MKLTLTSENGIRLEPVPGPMTIEPGSADQTYSPFHMIGGALGYCTLSVMFAWAEQAGLKADDLALDVSWTFVDDPHRIDAFEVRFSWPSLPPRRVEAAKRVAELCTVHATLQHPPTIAITAAS